MFRLNYIGSKKSLLETIDKVFEKYVDSGKTFADLFAGTGAVAKFVHDKYHCKVIANDMQYYAYIINKASLTRYTRADISRINELVAKYNALGNVRGFFVKNYAPPKRMYFTAANAGRIDAMRGALEKDRPYIDDRVYVYMLANIISCADKVANTSAVYASYLKEFKDSALREMTLMPFNEDIPNNQIGNRVYNSDILELGSHGNADVIYLDPPYNNRQYSDNYHVLETIAKYDNPKIHGITGLRDDLVHGKSLFSTAHAIDHFAALVTGLVCKVLILSYNDEGIMSMKDIRRVLKGRFAHVKLYKIPYKKFIAQDNVERKTLYEYLFVATSS
jgi:adenine-specific DNA-methyltransferase